MFKNFYAWLVSVVTRIFQKKPAETPSNENSSGSNLETDSVKVSIHIKPSSQNKTKLQLESGSESESLSEVVADKRRTNKYDIWHKVDKKGTQLVLRPKQTPISEQSTDQSDNSDAEHTSVIQGQFRKHQENVQKLEQVGKGNKPDKSTTQSSSNKSQKPERSCNLPGKSTIAKILAPFCCRACLEYVRSPKTSIRQKSPEKSASYICRQRSPKREKTTSLRNFGRTGKYTLVSVSDTESSITSSESEVEFKTICNKLSMPAEPLPIKPKKSKKKSKKARKNRRN